MGPGVSNVPAQAPDESTAESTAEHLDQLKNIREGLVDAGARPEQRRRWADMLLSYNSPQANALIIELLGFSENPDVQRALCGVIADRARRAPERLDTGFVPPLLDLLGAEAEDLRVMAARALVDFPGADVPEKLGQLASQDDVPLVKRLAAIDALAPNTHRREVVDQLISLLDAGVPRITERVVAALEPATRRTFDLDLEGWQRWWREKSQLSEEAWLAEQSQIHRDRSRCVADEFLAYRKGTRREHEAITARIGTLQRDLFRFLNEDQRETRLAEWLDDPLPVVKRTALAIIKARIADEGKRPEGKVLDTLLGLLKRGSPVMRREVLEIVQNLNDPAIVEAVLSQLEQEGDPTTRHEIFKAIGKLDSPTAIPALIREIAAPESPPDCVREAAIALGRVAAQSEAGDELRDARAALKNRYQLIATDDVAMRAALLTAMAGVADSAFTPEFLDAVESDNGTVLRPAIRGILAVGDTSKLPRLRTLMAHPEPLVRLAAIEAVGRLGREDADLESLLTRLNRTIETNELAREAAWRGFRALLSERPVRDRIKAAERLRDRPDLEVQYLVELADTLSTFNGDTLDLEAVLDRLAAVLVSQGRYGEAVELLRQVYDMRFAHSAADATEYARRLLDATLRSPADHDVAGLIRELAAAADGEAAKAQIVDTIAQYLESPQITTDPERARTLLTTLRSVPPETLGEAWTQLLEQVAARLESGDSSPAPSSPPGGSQP